MTPEQLLIAAFGFLMGLMYAVVTHRIVVGHWDCPQ